MATLVAAGAGWAAFPPSAQPLVRAWEEGLPIFNLFTSGSTGQPKSILLHRSQLEASARATGLALGYQPGACQLIALDLARIGGLMCLVRGLVYGWSFVFAEPAADPFATLSSALALDHTSLVPLQAQAILANVASREAFSRLQTVLIGGAALSPSLEQSLASLEVPAIYHTFGMSETVSHIALRRLNGPAAQSQFHLLAGVEARQDVQGCLAISGAMTAGIWVQSHDVVSLEGRAFSFLGREDAVINTGGIKVHPEQVETALGPLLQQAGFSGAYQIKGTPNERLGSQVTLFLEGAPMAEEWQKHLLTSARALLGPYPSPKSIIFLPSLPRSVGGKLIRV